MRELARESNQHLRVQNTYLLFLRRETAAISSIQLLCIPSDLVLLVHTQWADASLIARSVLGRRGEALKNIRLE